MRHPRPSASRLAVGLPICAAVGFVVGVMTTFKVRAGVTSGVPYGLVLSLLLVAVLVLALRLGLRSRVFGLAAAVGVVAAVGLLALPSAGGSVVLPFVAAGAVWRIGAPIVALLAVAVPLPANGSATTDAADGILGADEGTLP